MTFNLMTLGYECCYVECHCGACRDYLNAVLSVFTLNVVMLSVGMLNVVMMSVMAPKKYY